LQGEVELRSGGCKTQPSLIWIKPVGTEDGNYETVTTPMQPSVIVWDLETSHTLEDAAKDVDALPLLSYKRWDNIAVSAKTGRLISTPRKEISGLDC
jgi:hypothetical protein